MCIRDSSLTLLTDVDSLPDPLHSPVRLTGNDCSLVPVDDVIFYVKIWQESQEVMNRDEGTYRLVKSSHLEEGRLLPKCQ